MLNLDGQTSSWWLFSKDANRTHRLSLHSNHPSWNPNWKPHGLIHPGQVCVRLALNNDENLSEGCSVRFSQDKDHGIDMFWMVHVINWCWHWKCSDCLCGLHFWLQGWLRRLNYTSKWKKGRWTWIGWRRFDSLRDSKSRQVEVSTSRSLQRLRISKDFFRRLFDIEMQMMGHAQEINGGGMQTLLAYEWRFPLV